MSGILLQGLNAPFPLEEVVLTQGTFDGVHLGHQHVLQSVVNRARSSQRKSVLLTFYPHPRHVVQQPDKPVQLLNNLEEKSRRIFQQGIDYIWVLPFDQALSELEPAAYIHDVILARLRVKEMVVGYDHRFGKNRAGGLAELASIGNRAGFVVSQIPASEIEAIAVSSSRIRKALQEGHMDVANSLLGEPYSLSGIVIKGLQLGRKLGFPTANIELNEMHKLIPPYGVYAGYCEYQNQPYTLVMNIGIRPTIEGRGLSGEAHLLDFQGDLYGQHLEFHITQYIRPEKRFDNLEALSAQIAEDVAQCRQGH
ncbi:MAG: bifunctional riboflavin kinase/FAD synthetase [Bacteroidia bacterium]